MNNASSQRQKQIDRVGFGININWNSIDREIIEWASPETVERERWYVIEGGRERKMEEREMEEREMEEEREKLKAIEKWQQKWEREKERMVERRWKEER